MEKQDLNKLLITEEVYYNPNALYVNILQKRNITTVGQLLDNYNNEDFYINYSKYVRGQVFLLASMLEHKYLDKPLLFDAIMDGKIEAFIVPNKYYHFKAYIRVINSQNEKMEFLFTDFLGCSSPIVRKIMFKIEKFDSMFLTEEINLSYKYIPKHELSVINFLKWVLTLDKNIFKEVYPYINTYIEEYEQENKLENNDSETISFLKSQLSSLVKTKEDLDKRIINLQNQIDIFSCYKNKGNM